MTILLIIFIEQIISVIDIEFFSGFVVFYKKVKEARGFFCIWGLKERKEVNDFIFLIYCSGFNQPQDNNEQSKYQGINTNSDMNFFFVEIAYSKN